MSKTRVIKRGEHMSRIAAEEGFANFRTIVDRPENADLESKRDPHILFPGDQVFIPDRAEKDEERPTDDTHQFATEGPPLFVRCSVLDIDGKKVGGATCNLKIDGEGCGSSKLGPSTDSAPRSVSRGLHERVGCEG
jgi:hypothetical protein